MGHIKESDWKVFKQLHAIALNRFCERVLREASGIIANSEATPHQSYKNLYQLLAGRDEILVRIFDDFRRSTALWQLRLMVSNSLLTENEIAKFSPEAQKFADSITLELNGIEPDHVDE